MADDGSPRPGLVHRLLGPPEITEQLGLGVMDKSGVERDITDESTPTFSLVHVLRGTGRYRDWDNRWHGIRAGDCFMRIPGHRHSTEIDPASRWLELYVDLGRGVPAALIPTRLLRPHPPVWHWGIGGEQVARFAVLRDELAQAHERDLLGLYMRCLSFVAEAITARERSRRTENGAVERLCGLLSSEATSAIDLRAFCRREGLAYDRFRREFAKHMGISPGQYRIRCRIERAYVLLSESSASLDAVAEQLGYSSTSEFSVQFRCWTGVPPGRWRLRHRHALTGPSAAARTS